MDAQISINITVVIGLIAIAQAFLLGLFVVLFNFRSLTAWNISIFLFCLYLALGHDVLLYSGLAMYVPTIVGLGPFGTYLVGPLILLLGLKVVWPERKHRMIDALHFLPFVIHFIYRIPSVFKPLDEKLAFLHYYYQNTDQFLQLSPFDLSQFTGIISFYGHRFIYIFLVFYLLIRNRHRFRHALAGRKQIYRLLVVIIPAYTIGWLLLQISKYNSSVYESFITLQMIMNAISLTLMILAMAVICFRYQLSDIFSAKSTEKYKQSKLDKDVSAQVISDLQSSMLKNHWYIDNDYNLTKLSDDTGYPAQIISQVLNSHLELSFNDFINEYRLNHVLSALKKPNNAKLDILELAHQSGFNSKATFYRVFKEKMRMTPKEYRKSVLS